MEPEGSGSGFGGKVTLRVTIQMVKSLLSVRFRNLKLLLTGKKQKRFFNDYRKAICRSRYDNWCNKKL
ncbi:MAG: hypothetical protein ACLVI9_03255 [Anaerostipes hadrus]